MAPAAALQIDRLCKNYGALVVTDNVTISIAPSTVHALIGPNGAGKSTLIGQISGELLPDSGYVRLFGEDITGLPPEDRAKRGLSRSYQISSVLPEFSLLENVLLAARAQRASVFDFRPRLLKSKALIERCHGALSDVGLADHISKTAARLSYGQKRQLELAMAISQEPKVLLLDEPLAGMSPREGEQIVSLIHRLGQRYAVLLVEHDMPAVFSLATTISVLVHGQIAASGTPREIRDDPVVRSAYLGDEEIAA